MKTASLPLPAFRRPCARLGRGLTVLLGPAVLLLAGLVPPPASAQGFVGVEPGTPIPLDVNSGVITDPLPFDVHFYLTGKAADAVHSMEGRSLGFETAQTCVDALSRIRSCPASDRTVVDCNPFAKAALLGNPGARTFELLVPALQPNRYYCFEIVTLSDITDPAERTRVETAVNDAVAEVMSQSFWLDPANIQSTAALRQLRARLLAAARESLGPGKVLQGEEGSFFDEGTDVSEFDATVGDQVSAFLMAQLNVADARNTLQQRATSASGALTRLSTSPLWQIIAEALQANATQPRVAQLLAGRQEALGLIGLSSSEIVARSEGHTGTLDQVWDAAQIDFASVRQQVGALRDIAAELRTDEDLRKAAGLDEPALSARVAQACGSTIPASDPVCDASPRTSAFFQKVQDLANGAAAAFDSEGLAAAADNLRDVLRSRSTLLEALAADLRALLLQVANVRASTVASYETRATWYVGADLGTALAWDLEEAFTYGGANVYFRPVNKKAHLRWSDWRRGQRWTEFRKRFSIMIGLPQEEIEVENGEPLLQNRPALLGAGLRLSDYLRLTFAGALVFKEQDPNPLVDDERLAWSPFVGLSIDWNIAGTFRTMFRSVFPGQDPAAAPAAAQQQGGGQ